MKTLDKYIAKNFITGYVIAFGVLVGLRIVIDLFVNLDEFAERADAGALAVVTNMFNYYGTQIFLYFRDFAGMITIVAAVFTFGKMVRNNELTAIMASGVSLRRILLPILLIALLLTAVYVIDQELIIPQRAEQLVRKQDAVHGKGNLDVWFLSDSAGSLICSSNFDIGTGTLHNPIIFLRQKVTDKYYKGIGQIRADSASYAGNGRWELVNGIKMTRPKDLLTTQSIEEPIEYYQSDITPGEIPVRRKANFMDLLSSRQLSDLLAQGPKIKDRARLYAQKHERITIPIINFIMLMIALPILVCREPKAMKSAMTISFVLTTACFITTFACKMLAGENTFIRPEAWAWIPIAIFLPVAIIELDAMKT